MFSTMKKSVLIFGLAILVFSCRDKNGVSKKENYKENWTSLCKHQTPIWFDGLKFGIYCHWGPQSVEVMDKKGEITRLEAIEKWKGEKFDAVKWVDLMQRAGAQFGGPVAWHGSGMVNWNSDFTDWNSTKKGPKVDIYGSLAKELKKRNMPLIASYHTGDFWSRMWGQIAPDNKTIIDPEEDNSNYKTANNGRVSDEIFEAWYARISESIDKYEPDIIWFDTGFGGTVPKVLKGHVKKGRLLPNQPNSLISAPEKYQQKLISYFFNKGIELNKEVEVVYKTHDLPVGIGVRDIEDGNLIGLQYDPWMSDVNMQRHFEWRATWFYNPVNKIKSAGTLVDMLIDMTSKNGRMLLNVPPKSDGSFAPEVKKELHDIGDWLQINGEAIYGTMPWVLFGEGPTEVTNPGHHGQGKNHGELIPKYTAEDIRFTQKGKKLYAIVMDWPGEEINIRSLGLYGKLYPGDIKSVEVLGSSEKINWDIDKGGMHVKFPKEKPCDFAYVIKIERI